MKIAIYQNKDSHGIYENIQQTILDCTWIKFDIKIFSDYKNLITTIMNWHVDILYIDLDYDNEIDGMQLAKNIYNSERSCLIFIVSTNVNRFQEAFSVHAYQYIVKPFDFNFFKNELMRAIYEITEAKQKFMFPTTVGNVILDGKEIMYITTSYREYKLRTYQKSYYGKAKSIAQTKKSLIERNFVKIERSVLVNLKYVNMYSGNCIEMMDGEVFLISKRNLSLFKERLVQYLAYCKD